MFLKRITLAGFKSFCDRVDFDFGPGITCIVGPNGCGKSNVVDAFKWVLGEQSAKSLRGRQMIDMIFNGSSGRRASSVAQVDLVFDNADRTLACDADEVTVTRKLYRSGESEYQLNTQISRLKDVRTLFMDTGIGVDAYSIIEQGRVDGLLRSSSQERRTIFEEAAGISKYKARRIEAERKLERTSQNLLRVHDIVEEIEKRLRSVKLQAAKARNYQAHAAKLSELRSMFSMAEYHRYCQAIQEHTEKSNSVSDQASQHRAAISRDEADSAALLKRLDELAEQISQTDSNLVQGQSNLATFEERIETATQREQEQKALLESANERLVDGSERKAAANRELDSVQAELDELDNQQSSLNQKLAELSDIERSLNQEHAKAMALLDDEKTGIIDLVRRSAQTHNEITRFNTHRESLVDRKGRLSERDAKISSELEDVFENKAHLQRRLNEVEELIATETQTLDVKKAEAIKVTARKAELESQVQAVREQRTSLLSRRELLDDLERKMEGVGVAARRILDGKRRENHPEALDCAVGLVADILEADVSHAPMIEAALRGWDGFLVVTESRPLLSFLSSQELPGRLTLLCLDQLPPIVNDRDWSEVPGVIGRASDLVRVDEPYEHLARHLLGKTIVVESLETALAFAKNDVHNHRFVTLAAEVVEPDGRVSIGKMEAHTGLISRKSELRDIDIQMALADENLSNLNSELTQTQANMSHLDQVQQELRAAIYESSTARIEANTALQSITDNIHRLTSEQPVIAQEAAMIEQGINDAIEKSEASNRSLQALEQENKDREQKIEARQSRIDSIAVDRNAAQERLTNTKVQLGQFNEKRNAAKDRASALQRTIADCETTLQTASREMQQCETRMKESQALVVASKNGMDDLRISIDDLREKASELRLHRERLRNDIDSKQESVREARSTLEKLEEKLHEHQVVLSESNVRRDDLIQRVRDELEIDLALQYEEYQHEEQDWGQIEEEITTLRKKMERLGNVNLDAINELVELEERHGFLTTQCNDLEESSRKLELLIAQLNTESQERFYKSFIEIRDHFREMFRKLFGGGRADIVLETPDNVLESGIEIIAQPPGKELQAITLMSGGEKSMTAIALLMSIFKSRPAPFAILDEVDAALDEANNERFNRIVKEFVSEAQFLVISHSKWTMSIGDHLYGITMQEPGVSTRVGVELKDVSVA